MQRLYKVIETEFRQYEDHATSMSQVLEDYQRRIGCRRLPLKQEKGRKIELVCFGKVWEDSIASFMIYLFLLYKATSTSLQFDKQFLLMNANNSSRLSRIGDHNMYRNTDTLYDPLRNALKRSSISSTFLQTKISNNQNVLSASRVAKNMRSLSPAEVELIKKNTFITINKELVPTHNMQKVVGKSFIAVDMEQKVGAAITPYEFSRVKTNTLEEIVYQVKQENPSNNIYTYTTRNTLPVQQNYSIPQTVNIQSRSIIQNKPVISNVRTSYAPATTTVNAIQTPSFGSTLIRSPNGQVRSSKIFNAPVYNTTMASDELSFREPTQYSAVGQIGQNLPYSNLQNDQVFISQGSNVNSVTAPRLNANNNHYSQNQNNLYFDRGSVVRSNFSQDYQEVKSYNFKQGMSSGENSLIKIRRDKDEYKYNLFSLIDEGGNNGCRNGCFGSNQIMAPKITNNAWKN